jgi:DNA-binding protein Alba
MSEVQNVVYIGRKPVMSYVLAVITGFADSSAKDVALRARGRAITTAVDVAEVTRNRFIKELVVSNINIGTEEIEEADGRRRSVSTMEIVLTKQAQPAAKQEAQPAAKQEAQPAAE